MGYIQSNGILRSGKVSENKDDCRWTYRSTNEVEERMVSIKNSAPAYNEHITKNQSKAAWQSICTQWYYTLMNAKDYRQNWFWNCRFDWLFFDLINNMHSIWTRCLFSLGAPGNPFQPVLLVDWLIFRKFNKNTFDNLFLNRVIQAKMQNIYGFQVFKWDHLLLFAVELNHCKLNIIGFLSVGETQANHNQFSNVVASVTLKMTRVIRAGYITVLPDLISIMEKPVSRVSFKVD